AGAAWPRPTSRWRSRSFCTWSACTCCPPSTTSPAERSALRRRGRGRGLPPPLEVQVDLLQALEVGPELGCLAPQPERLCLAHRELGLTGGQLRLARGELGEGGLPGAGI